MTETKTSSFKKGTRCRICTGCGRCFGEKKIDAVSSFFTGDGEKSSLGVPAVPKPFPVQEDGKVQKMDCLVAVDIGTTTIAMQLRNMADGNILDTYTCINPQRNYGADVLSRMEAAGEPEAKKAMQEAVQGALKKGLMQFARVLCPKETAENQTDTGICGMSIAANTTMVHLLMGLDVSRLGQYPFEAETLAEIRTRLFDIDTVILPGISAFVGGDIVAGMEALDTAGREEITLLLDLGTNGEMVLGNRERQVAAATAAGPAFEGNSDCYGTDLMRLTARLLEEGILDTTGLLADPYFEDGIDIGGVHITQQYIRQLQMAKAAICTGICILCQKYGLQDFSEIDKVFLAGGMGYYLEPGAAAAIGLIPKALAGKTVAVGNAALEGAFVYGRRIFATGEGLSERVFAKGESSESSEAALVKEVPARPVVVYNLAEEPDFSEKYIANMELVPCGIG